MSPPRTTAPGASSPRNPLGFTWRLMASLGLVVLAAGATLLAVTLLVAPQVFRSHLIGVSASPIEPAVSADVDEVFANAIVVSLGIALPIALLTAFFVTWIVARRLGRSVALLAAAADRIARGDLRELVTAPAIGPEFAQLAGSFNAMAVRLAETESTRRRLIGDLAHELRTPLASLEATVEAVVDGVLPADDVTLATLREQTERLQHLVADMSAVSKAEERQLDLHTRRIDATGLATQAVAAAQARFVAAGVHLELDSATDAPHVWADPDRLAEVLANLLDNALRHTPVGGEVRVVVDADRADVTLAVVDTGEGFDPSDAARIFERFYRTDASRTSSSAGSGIGLTIARAIVEAHAGTLTASTGGPGKGAAFLIRLPRKIPITRRGVT